MRISNSKAESIDVGARNMRVLLGAMLADDGRVLPSDHLVNALWGQTPPRSAAKNLQVYIYRLRKLLGPETIESHPHGYALLVPDEAIDARVFRRLTADANDCAAHDPRQACTLLREALGLWSGKAFQDVADAPVLRETIASLHAEQISAQEKLFELELALGRHAAVVDELARAVASNPFRETFRRLYMVALFRCGRQSDAVDAFQSARKLLNNELGLEPGEQLQQAYLSILREQDPAPVSAAVTVAAPIPSQLPPQAAGFVGRAHELSQLDSLLGAAAPAAVISSISGQAGVGKTALAVHWASQVARRFPDGQLYLNLRGFSVEPPLSAASAVSQLLRALGVAPGQVPADFDEAVAEYRTQIARRRVLLILDNARDEQQVRPLLATGTSVTVVTSRNRLGGLVAVDGALPITVGLLSDQDSATLLQAQSRPRQAIPREQAAELALICGHLPLALRLAAARLALDPTLDAEELARSLREKNRLNELEVSSDHAASLRAIFTCSYDVLTADERRAFRLLALLPGTDISPDGLAAMLDIPPDECRATLTRLARVHLLTRMAHDRYTMHDLLRDYALEMALEHESQQDRDLGLHHYFAWQLATCSFAVALVTPSAIQLPLPGEYAVDQRLSTHDEAQAWLNQEFNNLLATITHCAEHGPAQVAWLLTDYLRLFLRNGSHFQQWSSVLTTALKSASESAGTGRDQTLAALYLSLGQLQHVTGKLHDSLRSYAVAREHAVECQWASALVHIESQLGGTYRLTGDFDAAITHLSNAAFLGKQTGQPLLALSAFGNLGDIYLTRAETARSIEQFQLLITNAEELGSQQHAAHGYVNLAVAESAEGAFELALEHASKAVEIYRTFGNQAELSMFLAALGEVYRRMGRHESALRTARDGLDIATGSGFVYGEASSLMVTAGAQRGLGRLNDAKENAQRALSICEGINSPEFIFAAQLCLAKCLHALREYDSAAQTASTALALAQQHRLIMDQAIVLNLLAKICLSTNDPAGAAQRAQQALSLWDTPDSRSLLARAQRLRKKGSERES